MTVAGLDSMAVEVTATFDAPVDTVWPVLSNVERMAGLGPEHFAARWDTPGPATGARFTGRNRMGDFEWEVRCIITACRPPEFIEWTVGMAPDHSSTWSYELWQAPGPSTVVVQRFAHGPGFSYLRQRVDTNPRAAASIIERRSAMLRANMQTTLAAVNQLLAAAPGAAP